MSLKFTLFVIFALLINAPAQTSVGERHYEPAGGFSFCPPAGWEKAEVQGQKYKVHILRADGAVAANIIVKDGDFDGTLEEFVSGNMLMFTQMSEAGKLKSYKSLGKTTMSTLSNGKVIKAAIEQELNGRLFRQTFYSFDGPTGRKVYLTCTVPTADADKFDKAFDESAKTFRVEGPPAAPKP
jgi:hypothetical protein